MAIHGIDLACKAAARLERRMVDKDQARRELTWAEACRREEIIRGLLAGAGRSGRIGRPAMTAAAASLGIHVATLYHLLKRFRADRRVSALEPGKRGRPTGNKQLTPEVEAVIATAIEEIYLQPERATMRALVRDIHRRCYAKGLHLPAYRTIKHRVDSLDPKTVARRRRHERTVEGMRATPGMARADAPLDFVQIDHTQVDLFVVDEDGREPIGRPWLTIGVDVFSRMVTGFYLSFQEPSLTSVSLCLLHSVFDKTPWLQSLGIDVAWPVAGLPARIGVDNAAEFRSGKFERGCREFGIKVEYRPPGGKHYGGHIERLIGTQMGAVQLLPGTTHGSIEGKQGYDPQRAAALTLKELETWIALEIAGHYHHRIHGGLHRPPIAVWREGEDQRILNLPSDRMQFWVNFLPGEARTLRRDGIHLFGLPYWSDALRADVGRTTTPFDVRYDPRDISRLFVRRPNGHWVEARYRDLRLPAISLWEHARARKLLLSQGHKELRGETILRTAMHQRELVQNAVRTIDLKKLYHPSRMPRSRSTKAQSPDRLTGIDLSRPPRDKQ